MKPIEFDKRRNRVKECPCGKSNKDGKFVPFIGYDNKGFCHSCGKTFQIDIEKPVSSERPIYGNIEKLEQTPSYINTDLVRRSMVHYKRNIFALWLVGLFGEVKAKELIELYGVGTSKHWDGANIFWYCDISRNYRTGKIMLYDSDGHRKKQNKPNWVHSVLKLENYNMLQCFFGEHLLNKPENLCKKIIIVESEKSAIVGNGYFPNFVWIACGGVSGLTESKCIVLERRNIILYPDLGMLGLWNEQAAHLRKICTSVRVIDFLEQNATNEEKARGLDVADYLAREKPSVSKLCEGVWKDTYEVKSTPSPQIEIDNIETPNTYENECAEIEEMEKFFSGVVLPTCAVRLDQCTITNDISYCIQQALYNAKLTVGKQHIGRVCLQRLRTIRKAVSNE